MVTNITVLSTSDCFTQAPTAQRVGAWCLLTGSLVQARASQGLGAWCQSCVMLRLLACRSHEALRSLLTYNCIITCAW